MLPRLKSPFIRSLAVHALLLGLVALLVYHPHEDQVLPSPLIIENISLGREVRKAVHTVVHSIGLPHDEPEEEVEPEPTSSKASSGPSQPESGGLPSSSGGSEIQKYLAQVVARIEAQKTYPREARFAEQEGRVQLLVEVSESGRMIRAEVETGTPFPTLNEAALAAVKSVFPLPPPPNAQPGKSLILHVPIHFQIER